MATVLGLVVAVSIVMSIPLYTDAVYYKILQDELTASEDGALQRPPFAFMFRYVGSLSGLLEWDDIEDVDDYLTNRAVDTLGLPRERSVRYMRTDNFRLFPTEDLAYANVKDPLEWVSYAFISDVEDQITLLEGEFPEVADSNADHAGRGVGLGADGR